MSILGQILCKRIFSYKQQTTYKQTLYSETILKIETDQTSLIDLG